MRTVLQTPEMAAGEPQYATPSPWWIQKPPEITWDVSENALEMVSLAGKCRKLVLLLLIIICTHVWGTPTSVIKKTSPCHLGPGGQGVQVQWFWVIAKFSRVKHQAFTTGVLPVRKSKWYLKYAVFLRHKKETHHASSYPCDVGSKTLWTTLPPHQILAANDTCSPWRTGFCLLTGWQWYSYPLLSPKPKNYTENSPAWKETTIVCANCFFGSQLWLGPEVLKVGSYFQHV